MVERDGRVPAAVLTHEEAADVVDEVVLDHDAAAVLARLDIDADLAVGVAGVRAKPADVVDVVADDLRVVPSVVEVDSARAAPGTAGVADV